MLQFKVLCKTAALFQFVLLSNKHKLLAFKVTFVYALVILQDDDSSITPASEDDRSTMPTSPYPCLVLTQSEIFSIYVQKERVVVDVQNTKEAVAMLLSTYWIFDIRYPKNRKNTLSFSSWLFGQDYVLPVSVKRLVNCL